MDYKEVTCTGTTINQDGERVIEKEIVDFSEKHKFTFKCLGEFSIEINEVEDVTD